MNAIFKREFKSYFNSMVGYFFIAVMLVFTGIYFMGVNLMAGYPRFSYALLNIQVVCLFAIPILTMRSMAEERRSKSDQLWITAPISLTKVVVGKYLAMVGVFAIPMLISCLCPLIIKMNGVATLASDYASIFAFFLIGCVYIAVGMWVSSLTESQIIASVSTFAALLVMYMWSSIVTLFPTALQPLLQSFDFQGPFINFAQYDMIDVGGIILYLSMIAVFVFLTVQSLQKRRWN